MNSYELNYQRRVGNYAVAVLAAHVPLMIAAALVFGTSGTLALGGGLLILSAPVLLHLTRPGATPRQAAFQINFTPRVSSHSVSAGMAVRGSTRKSCGE